MCSCVEVLDDAGTQLFTDQSVNHRVDGWWDYDEQDAAEFPNIQRQRGEWKTHNYAQCRYYVKQIHHKVCCTSPKSFGVDREACLITSDSGMQDCHVGESDDEEDACTQSPGQRQT